MKKIAVSLLACGDEHINECNYLLNSLSKYKEELNFIVASDSPEKIKEPAAKIIKINEDFNFNLKRIPIKVALDEHDIVLSMDTDMFITNKNVDFSMLHDLDDGMYVWWLDKEVDFMGEKITINGDGKSDVNNEYLRKLHELNDSGQNLFFLDECFILLKLSDLTKKKEFIDNWNHIYKETLYTQPSNGLIGAMEGLIIYLSCLRSYIKIYNVKNDELFFNFFCNFYHCNHVTNRDELFKSNVKKII